MLKWVALGLLALVILLGVGSYFVDEPLRQYMETRLNSQLKGYSVRLPGLSFHPLGFSITLQDLTIAQTAHPRPPVARFPKLHASVHWRALLHARLVADFLLSRPQVHVNLPQLQHEVANPVPVKQEGWQEALETIYPLKINRLRIEDATVTYIDDDPKRPLHIRQLNITADNIRNVRSPDHVYPSDVHIRGVIFDSGSMRVDGKANFLAEPFVGVDADIVMQRINLAYFKPILARMNVQISDGSLSADGHVEYAPHTQAVHIKQVALRGIRLDYTHSKRTADVEKERAVKVGHAAQELTEEPVIVVRVDKLRIANSTIGYVDQSSEPNYRVYMEKSDLAIDGLSNQASDGPASIDLEGQFMGSGSSQLHATFQPMAKSTTFDASATIEGTDLRALNDFLRAFGNFDVVSGEFFLYSQLTIDKEQISGYLKPIFRGVQVYGRPQDTGKPVLHQIYEGLIGALKVALQNTKGEVGTKVDISGGASDPKTSRWEILFGLVKNAFIKAITHGLEQPSNPQSEATANP